MKKTKQADPEKNRYLPVLIGAGLIMLAVLAGILVNVLSSPRDAKPEPTPAPSATVTAPPTPTPTPDVTSIRLYAYGREIDADGFTLYVGDKPVEISAVIEPAGLNLPVGWTLSDQGAASLEVSGDGLICKVTALKPNGRNELTVICQNLYTSVPVFLWEK